MKIDRHNVIHVSRVPRGDGQEYRIDIGLVREVPCVIIRRFEPSPHGKPHPTSEALAFNVALLPMVRAALKNAELIAHQAQLLQQDAA